MPTPLQPTDRTSITRGRDRAVAERSQLHALLTEAMVAHVGVVMDGHPVVLPSAFSVDLDGPDADGTLYLHGSVGAGWIRRAPDTTVCVSITELDGLVLARSPFHHSVNYRSAVVIGVAQLVPGRSVTLRRSTRKELAATAVLAVSLAEASMKRRSGGPVDDQADIDAGVWGGTLPLSRVAGPVTSSADSHDEVPPDVLALARALA